VIDNLNGVSDALSELAKISSRNEKLEKLGILLKETPWLKNTVIYALHPHMHYNINKLPKATLDIKQTRRVDFQEPGAIFHFLMLMSNKRGATDSEKQFLANLCSYSDKTRDVVLKILKKDLRCGVNIKTAQNFISEDELPLYEVMKPKGDNPFPDRQWQKFLKLAKTLDNIGYAIKVDGFRISYATVQRNGEVEYLSTNGKPYENFKVFDKELVRLAKTIHFGFGVDYPMVFDGECVSKDGDFQSMQKHARRIYNIDPEIYRFLVWDVICDLPYIERYNMLGYLHTTSGEKYDFLKLASKSSDKVFRLKHMDFWDYLVGVGKTTDPADAARILTKGVIADGNEGIILKTKDHRHEMERSDHWFRIKALYLKGMGIEVDLPVIGFEYGRKGTRMEEMLGAFICEYKGKKVRVSGKMSDDQRKAYVEDLPSVIEVHADSETNDGSLRLPIFQRVREDK